MPVDINCLRAEKGGDVNRWREMTKQRFKPVELVDNVIALDEKWRKAQFEMEQARKALGVLQKELGAKMKAKENADAEKARKAEFDAQIAALEVVAKELAAARDRALELVPNELDPTVPVSNDEKDNAVVARWGALRPSTADLLHHHELLAMIDGYEPERGAGVAGHRGYFLKGVGLLLNQALINYGLQFLSERAYTPVQPPYFMNKDIMAGVAQLSDFDEQLYKVGGEGGEEKYLIATSEQPICAFHRGEWLDERDLPKRYAGYSTCFRKEAGSHGRDAWGIFRVHQFEKVEQFVVCSPDESPRHHQEMVDAAAEFYKTLGLAHHVVCIVSGELNNAAAKKFDLEAWFPTLGVYRELVSASNCTDYQSRAMEVRMSPAAAAAGGTAAAAAGAAVKKPFVHFLNSTLCATTRTLCCVLENYQTPEGVKVPDVLVPFMGGRTFLPFVKPRPAREGEKPAAKAAAAAGGDKPKAAVAATGGEKSLAPAKAAPTVAAAPAAPVAAAAAAPAAVVKAAAAAPATVSAAAVGATLSPHVLGIVGRPALPSATGSAALDAALAGRSYVAGFAPSAEDEAVYAKLAAAGAAAPEAARAAGLANTARWLAHVASYSAAERAAWPLSFAQLTSGALDARASSLFA